MEKKKKKKLSWC